MEGARYARRLPRPRSKVLAFEEAPHRDGGDWAPDTRSRFEVVSNVSPVEGLLGEIQTDLYSKQTISQGIITIQNMRTKYWFLGGNVVYIIYNLKACDHV